MSAEVVADKKPDFLLPIYLPKPVVERGPCPRNREIFELVRIQHLTLRAAGEKHKLSTGRISQIVRQVQGWIARTGGGPTMTWSEKLRVSEYVHHERAERLVAGLMESFEKGVEVRTVRAKVCDGKPDERHSVVRLAVHDPKAGLAVWKVEQDRHAFIAAMRERQPNETTAAERLREAEGIVRDAAALVNKEDGKQTDAATAAADYVPEATALREEDATDFQEPVSEVPIAAPVPMTNDQAPMTTEGGNAESVAPPPAAPEPERRQPIPRWKTIEDADLTCYAPLPQPEYYAPPRVYINTPDGKPPPMLLIADLTYEELEQYWVLENGLLAWRPPTILGKRDPNCTFWQRTQPLPPNSARAKKKKPK